MAHGEDKRRAVRAAYVFEALDLPAAAIKAGVPEGTARRWKSQAREEGDDWDKACGAQLIAGGGLEEVSRQTLAMVVLQVNATLQALNDKADMDPATKVSLLASLSDSYAKLTKVATKLMPETSQLATSMDVLQQFAQFIKERHPQHLVALVEVLEPFGEHLQQRYG